MKVCVFGGSMPMLVNGSPTEEVSIQRVLLSGWEVLVGRKDMI